MIKIRSLLLSITWILLALNVQANNHWVVESKKHNEDFPLVTKTQIAPIIYSDDDFKVVSIAAQDLASDIERVTGRKPELKNSLDNLKTPVIIIGTLGNSPLIDQLIAAKKLDVTQLQNQWESFLIITINKPLPDVGSALVIVGSDRRGTAFGVYELSQAMGVSPWYWWADVSPQKKSSIFISAGTRRFGPPSVKYRGIFINDEDWGMQVWAEKTFEPESGGIGPKTYSKLFELMLRLKANTVWPAMHPTTKPFNSFPQNAQIADDYAIVMGSSHAEPMLRNNVGEWKLPHEQYNYLTHRDLVYSYWQERMQTNGKFENIYTLGMRGIHDSLMQGPTTDAERIKLLETIFTDQRELITPHAQKSSEKIPQMFCAYKEVLGLYRQGLQVPDDVTIVWPDDNFGYVRYFANAQERKRAGGFGVYYHLSYLGAPMAYLWLNTTPTALIWQEMSKSYEMGADRIWIVNVGDLKPAEIGTELFLQMAWDIKRWQRHNQTDYLREWATREFGEQQAETITALMHDYYRLNFQRKPEHLQWWLPRTTPQPSNLTAEESRERLQAFIELRLATEKLAKKINSENQDAFFQLVSYPIVGSALANIRFLEGEKGNRTAAINADTQLKKETARWNSISKGKWKHFMALEPADTQWDKYRISPWQMPEIKKTKQPAIEPAEKILQWETESFTSSTQGAHNRWEIIDNLGRTGPGSISVFPVAAPALNIDQWQQAPRLDYTLKIPAGDYQLCIHLLPSHPLAGTQLIYAIGINGAPPELVSLDVDSVLVQGEWAQGVLNNSRTSCSSIVVTKAGKNKLNIYGLNAGVILDSFELFKNNVDVLKQ
jgi:hypothetical protein